MKTTLKKAVSIIAAAGLTISLFSALTVSAAVTRGVPSIPVGAIDVNSITVKSTSAQTLKDVVVATDGKTNIKRDVAYTNSTDGIWYLGDYDLTEIASIDIRAALVPKVVDNAVTATPQIRFAYMSINDGETVDGSYISENDRAIRNNGNIVARIEGTTLLNSDYADNVLSNTPEGHKKLGALFTITPDKTSAGVTADTTEYAYYPGGQVTFGNGAVNNSAGLDTSKGKVHLFVYGNASNCRVAIDYIDIHQKEYNKIDLSGTTAKMWSVSDSSHTNGNAYTCTTSKIENTRNTEATETTSSNKVENLYDDSITTSIKPSQRHPYIIDLGKEVAVSKFVINADTTGTFIYGLAAGTPVISMANSNSASETITSDNWFRANADLDTKKIDSNYSVSREVKTEGGTEYWEFTLRATGKPQAYRYIIIDDNNSTYVCYDISVYSSEDANSCALTHTDTSVDPAVTSTTKYETFEAAVAASQAGDTITLLDDVTLSENLDIANNTNLTIDGGYKTITTAKRIEYKAGGTLTLKNLTIRGGGYLNIPSTNLIYADNLKLDALNIGGSTQASKGTVSNSEIGTMTLYGKIKLENTKVTTVVIKKINAGGVDIPQITADAGSSVGTLSAAEVVFGEGLTFPYDLMPGALKAIGTATLPEGYEYDSTAGQICRVQAPMPEIVIGEKNAASIAVSVANPTAETNSGVLIAALYSDGICVSVDFVEDGTAVFNRNIDDGMTVKAFLWSSFAGENAMQPILSCKSK